jgi:PAS domain S-box-containing protein
MSLHRLLTRLIWLCVAPLVLLAAYLAISSVMTQQAERDLEAANLAKSFATAIDQHLNARIGALHMLTKSPLLDDASHRKDLYREAQGFQQSFGSHVILADLQMHMLFNTRVPFGTKLSMLPRPKGHAAAPAAVETGNPAVGDTFFGPIALEPLVAIAVPAKREGKTVFLLLTIFETRQFQERLDRMALPSGWSLSLLDGKHEVIARRAPPGLNPATDVDPSGRFVVKSAMSPWSMVLEIPRDIYREPLIKAAAALAIAILGATLISVLGGMLASRRLGRSVASLAEAPAPESPPPDIAEIAAVRCILDKSAQKREAAEAILQAAQRLAGLGNWEWNIRTDTHTWSEEIYRIYGRDPARPPAIYPEVQKYFTPESWARLAAAVEIGLAKGVPYECDAEVVRPDGIHRWVVARGEATRDTDGNVVNLHGTVQDITERKRAEENIRRLNRVLAVLSDINQAIVRIREPQALFDKACQIAVENGNFSLAWIGLLDEASGEVKVVAQAGKSDGYLEKINISLKDGPLGYCPIDRALREGKRAVCKVIGQTDHPAPCQKIAHELGFRSSASFPLLVFGRIRGTVNLCDDKPDHFDEAELKLLDEMAMDISFAMEFAEKETERERAEETVRESERRYRSLFENMLEGFAYCQMLFDGGTPQDFLYLDVNNAFSTLTGLKNVVGKKVSEVIPGLRESNPGLFEVYGRVSLTGRPERLETYVESLGIWFSIAVYSPRKEYFIAVFDNITERKAAEAALLAQNEEIGIISQQLWQAAKLATMGELASSIAHELNNPLATVSLRIESLTAQTSQDDPRRRELEIIGQEVERMGNLVTNLLQFCRRSQKQISTVDIREEIEKTVELIHYHFRKNNIQVIREFAPEIPVILADRQQLRQLFLNLFTNASDSMPKGGTLTIRVAAQPEEKKIIIEIADTGIGIPPEILPKVMEPFYTTKPEGKGTGLGLAICRRIAQEHRGTLDITSEGIPGKGTKVRITLSSMDTGNSIGLTDP